MTPFDRRRFLTGALGAAAGLLFATRLPRPAVGAPLGFDRPLLISPGLGGPILTFSLDGGDLRQVGRGIEPSWAAARGGFVYAIWDDSPPGIFLADPDGGHQVLLVEGKEFLSPLVSPDGQQLAFLNRDSIEVRVGGRTIVDAETGINVIGIFGASAIAPPGGTRDNFGPGWSPDGENFLWSAENGLNRAYVGSLDPDQIRPQQKIPNTDLRFINPRWSPDGRTILFLWRQHDHWEVATIRPDGSGFRLLTRSAPFDPVYEKRSPVWSPDGSRIAYLSTQDGSGQFKLWMMNADGSQQRKLSDLPFQVDYNATRLLSWA